MTMMTEIGIMQTQAKENQRLLTNQQKVERGQEEVLHGSHKEHGAAKP